MFSVQQTPNTNVAPNKAATMRFFRRRSHGAADRSTDNVDDTQQFQQQVQTLIPAEIRMISGCHSEQTSADVSNAGQNLPNPAGRAGGACTSALLELLYNHARQHQPHLTFQSLLLELRQSLQRKGLEQIPQLSSSRPLELEQTPFSLCSNPGQKRALLVGINYRGQSGELRGCHNDILNVKRYLIQHQKYQEQHILMLLDDGTHIFPTRQKIILGLQQLVAHSQPGDNCYFHYSGHGGLLSPEGFNAFKFSNSSDKEYDETLYPVDHEKAGQIRDFSLFHHFVKPMKAGVTVTCVLDCCHSGTVLDLPYTFQPTPAGEIRMRQSMDSLSNLAFLYWMAGGALPSLPGFHNVWHHLEQNVDGDLEQYQGTGVEELYQADQMDDAEFTTDAAQYLDANQHEASGVGENYGDFDGNEAEPVTVSGEDVVPESEYYDTFRGGEENMMRATDDPVVVQGDVVDGGPGYGNVGDFGDGEEDNFASGWNTFPMSENNGDGDDNPDCCSDILGDLMDAAGDE